MRSLLWTLHGRVVARLGHTGSEVDEGMFRSRLGVVCPHSIV